MPQKKLPKPIKKSDEITWEELNKIPFIDNEESKILKAIKKEKEKKGKKNAANF